MRRTPLLAALLLSTSVFPTAAEIIFRAGPGIYPPAQGQETPGPTLRLASGAASYRFDAGRSWTVALSPSGGTGPFSYSIPSGFDGLDATQVGDQLHVSGPGDAGRLVIPAIGVTDASGATGSSSAVRVTVGRDAILSPSASTLANLDVTPSGATSATVRIVNAGDFPTESVPTASASGSFEIVSSTCTSVLAGGAGCDVTVQGVATTDGPLSGTLSVAGLLASIQLSGSASGFAADVSGVESRRWRVIANNTWSPVDAGWIALAEIELRPTPGQRQNPENAGTLGGASQLNDAYGTAKATDGDLGSYLYARPTYATSQPPDDSGHQVFELILDYATPIAPTELYMHSARDGSYGRQLPHQFLAQYHDGSAWVTTDHVQGITGWAHGGEAKVFAINGG